MDNVNKTEEKPIEEVIEGEIMPVVETEEQRIERLAKEWIEKKGKGSPPKAIVQKIKELRAKDPKNKLAGREEATRLKQQAFIEEFLRNGGNATDAAYIVFNPGSRQAAAAMGHMYLKKARGAARMYLESKGYNYGRMLDVAAKKMEDGRTPEWWDRLMKLADYEDFITKKQTGPAVVNVIQTQNKIAEEFGFQEGEIIEDDTEADTN